MPAFTHRIVKSFPHNGTMLEAGSFASSHDWTWQGTFYVETMGWAKPLGHDEIELINNKPVVETPAKAVEVKKAIPAKKAVKKAPAKKATAKKNGF